MKMISIADNVLCINNEGHTSLVLGKIYTVKGLHVCSNCKESILDVGLKLPKKYWLHFCPKCESFSDIEDPIVRYAFASRFVKLDNLLDDCQWKKNTKKSSSTDISEIAMKIWKEKTDEFNRRSKK